MLRRLAFTRLVALATIALVVVAAPALADWDPGDGHKMHFPQLPDPTGFDVDFRSPTVLADDWLCSETGAVKDIHFWFSARGDWLDLSQPLEDQIFNIHVSVHSNIPADVGGIPFSRPGTLLWQRDYPVTAVTIRNYGSGDQSWYDAVTGEVIVNDHQRIFQCNITDIREPFYQKNGEIYWLDISISSLNPLGWKTADLLRYPDPYTGNHYEDDAVWRVPTSGWQELFFPEGPFAGTSMDLAFVITGEPIQWNHKMHFPQPPDPTGADVLFSPPYVVADDWRCSETGPVSDIHFWFSAFGDWLDPALPYDAQIGTVHISIHKDIPDPDGTGPLYSMPGPLVWERDYPVDQITITKCYTPGQDWYEPVEGVYIADDHYCMYRVDITNIQDPFEQNVGEIYWLDIWMDGQGPLGWKTADTAQYPPPFTGNHYQDDGVWAFIAAAPNWLELIWPPGSPMGGESIDLAFVITKDPPSGVGDGAPGIHQLDQNYPNPFNPTTTIRFTLSEPSDVLLAVYDVSGALVRVLERGAKPSGTFETEWDGRNTSGAEVTSGVYFYRLTAGSFSETRKMVLLK